MSRFNVVDKRNKRPVQPISTAQVADGKTFNGAEGFGYDAKSQLFLLSVSNFLGQDSFYESGKKQDDRFIKLIYTVADSDSGWLKRFLLWLRTEGNMRTAAIIGAAEAARAFVDRKIPGGRQLVASVLQRADEPGEMLAYMLSQYGRKIPKPIKRGIADAATRLYSEYSLLKYDTPSHAVRFGDVLELCHPDAKAPWQSHLFKFAIDRRHGRGSEDQAQHLPMVMAQNDLRDSIAAGVTSVLLDSEKLKAAGMTWEDALSLGGKSVDKRKLWEAMIPNMPIMALIRNLRNFDEAGVDDVAAQRVMNMLLNPEQIAKSRQLPMRFLSAYRHAPNLRWSYPLQQALDLSLGNIPWFPGRTLILIDTSGSMNQSFSKDGTLMRWDAAALFGLALARRCEKADVVSFASSSAVFPQVAGESLLTSLNRFQKDFFFNGGTDTHGAVRQHYRNHDRLVILTDEQANANHFYGGDVFAPLPKSAMGITFNLAGYQYSHAAQGGVQRPVIGGLTDQAFKLLPILESVHRGSWPF